MQGSPNFFCVPLRGICTKQRGEVYYKSLAAFTEPETMTKAVRAAQVDIF